jgi:hypothetical protein
MKKIFEFYNQNSAQVEFLDSDDKIKHISFPILPYCVFRSEKPRLDFLKSVNRANAKTKCEDLHHESGFILIGLKIDYFLVNKLGRFLGPFPKYTELWKNMILVQSIIINMIIIFSYTDS